MKRYIYFPTYNSNWSLTPQYVLCGNPRTVALNPISNATVFLWEQIEPNPITNPVSILPNNTSKNVTVVIPNTITTNIRFRVTLNGDTNNYKYVDIIPTIVDSVFNFSKGTGQSGVDNTLNALVPFLLAPYPPSGSQVIRYINNTQLTGVRLLSQSYRLGYTDSIDVLDSNNTLINNVSVYKTLYDNSLDNRLNLRVNTTYNLLKNWTNVKVFSQSIIPVNQSINIDYPTFIADEYTNSIGKGKGYISITRTPYLSFNLSSSDTLTNNFSKGSFNIGLSRTPYLSFNLGGVDNITNNISKGTYLISYSRTPYSANIIG